MKSERSKKDIDVVHVDSVITVALIYTWPTLGNVWKCTLVTATIGVQDNTYLLIFQTVSFQRL